MKRKRSEMIARLRSEEETPAILNPESRHDLRVKVPGLVCVTTPDGRCELLELVDVSAGGLGLHSGEQSYDLGEVFEVSFELEGSSITTTTRVVRRTKEHLGIQFVKISNDDALLIELFVSSCKWT